MEKEIKSAVNRISELWWMRSAFAMRTERTIQDSGGTSLQKIAVVEKVITEQIRIPFLMQLQLAVQTLHKEFQGNNEIGLDFQEVERLLDAFVNVGIITLEEGADILAALYYQEEEAPV